MVKEKGWVVEKERKEKAESIASTLRRKESWGDPSPQSEFIVTLRGCFRQGDFREGGVICLAPAELLSPVWGEDLGAWVRGGVFRWFSGRASSTSVSVSRL